MINNKVTPKKTRAELPTATPCGLRGGRVGSIETVIGKTVTGAYHKHSDSLFSGVDGVTYMEMIDTYLGFFWIPMADSDHYRKRHVIKDLRKEKKHKELLEKKLKEERKLESIAITACVNQYSLKFNEHDER